MPIDDPAVPKLDKSKALVRGDTRSWFEDFTENIGTDDDPDFVPLDVSGWTFICQIRADLNRGTLLSTLDVDDSDAAAGTLGLTLPSDEADALPGQVDPITYPVVYGDLQGTRTLDGYRKTFKRWQFKVVGDSSDV